MSSPRPICISPRSILADPLKADVREGGNPRTRDYFMNTRRTCRKRRFSRIERGIREWENKRSVVIGGDIVVGKIFHRAGEYLSSVLELLSHGAAKSLAELIFPDFIRTTAACPFAIDNFRRIAKRRQCLPVYVEGKVLGISSNNSFMNLRNIL